MAERALQQEERIGLAAALLLHGVLVAVLLQQAVRSEVLAFPERMEVSLVSEVGLESAARDPVPESRMAIAPTLGDAAPPPAEAPPPPQERALPQPQPQPRSTPAARTGGSRIGDDFLTGKGSSTRTDETRAPAAVFGASDRAALASAITRQIRPHWNAPSGADAEKLVSIVNWDLNSDGTLKGRPRCRVEPSSITESNQPQASLHCERAIRAVQLAAPFNLPEQFYDRWKALEWQFDRRL